MSDETPHTRPAINSVYRHKKRGTSYTIVAYGTAQSGSDFDNTQCVVYRNIVDEGEVWIRSVTEFMDGRFELVEPKSDEDIALGELDVLKDPVPLNRYVPDLPTTVHPQMERRDELWMIYFEDKSRSYEIYSGENAEDCAKKRYSILLDSWHCHLMQKVTLTQEGQEPITLPPVTTE